MYGIWNGTTPAERQADGGGLARLEQLLRRMRLPHMRRIAPEVLATAKAQRWDPAEVLRALLAEEVAGRDRSALATRRARAAFPTGKTFAAWDEHLCSIPAPTQAALRTLEWVGRHENLVVCGPSGTGKTFVLEALGQAAVETGKHVAWFTLEHLGMLIRAHRADDSVTKAIGRILRAGLVVVDVFRDIATLPNPSDHPPPSMEIVRHERSVNFPIGRPLLLLSLHVYSYQRYDDSERRNYDGNEVLRGLEPIHGNTILLLSTKQAGA